MTADERPRKIADEGDEALFDRARRGDSVARNTIVHRHLGLVGDVAARYRNVADYEDLFQEGVLGLMHAVDLYEFEGHDGASFQTYAMYWIRQNIIKAVRHTTTVHVANHTFRLEARARAGEELDARQARMVDRARKAWARSGPVIEEAHASSEHDPALQMERRDDLKALEEGLARLPAAHAEILAMRFGLDGGRPVSLATTARRLGVGVRTVKDALAFALIALAAGIEAGDPSLVSDAGFSRNRFRKTA